MKIDHSVWVKCVNSVGGEKSMRHSSFISKYTHRNSVTLIVCISFGSSTLFLRQHIRQILHWNSHIWDLFYLLCYVLRTASTYTKIATQNKQSKKSTNWIFHRNTQPSSKSVSTFVYICLFLHTAVTERTHFCNRNERCFAKIKICIWHCVRRPFNMKWSN